MGGIKSLLVIVFAVFFCVGLTAETDNSMKNRIKIRKKSEYERPGNPSEEYTLEKIEVLAAKRRNLILDIRRFIHEAKSEDQKTELNLRLGQLYMEDYEAQLAKAHQIYDRDIVAYKEKHDKSARAPKLDTSEATASLDRARALFKDLLARYPKHPRRDEMLFFLASSALDKGMQAEGMSYFQRLVTETPSSKYTNDALVQLADHYFDQNRFPEAEHYYDLIIEKKYAPLLSFAVYKKAWCEYNAGKHEKALAHFKLAIRLEDADEHSASQLKIKSEALKDITLPFVDLKLIDESIAFFQHYGDPHYRRGIETMASLYQESGGYAFAEKLYTLLLSMDPNHPKNPSYELAIVDGLKRRNEVAKAIDRLFNRIPVYLSNSTWHEINASQASVIAEAEKGFEEAARTYAIQLHAEGQKTKNDALYQEARVLYTKYLEFYPKSPFATKARFSLAEILYHQSLFPAAADQYYAVYKDPMAGALKFDAIRYALNSLDRQLNLDRKKAGLSEINSKQSTKIVDKDDKQDVDAYSDVEVKFLSISAEYLRDYPSAKDAADVLYEQAYLYYAHHDSIKSYGSFWALVNKYPTNVVAYPSANLILDILNKRKDYPRMIAACKKFLGTQSLSKPEFRAEVSDVLRKSELKRIQDIEAANEFKKAAEEYVEYTKAYGPQDEALFEKALYNASVDYTKANLYLSAVETQEKFLRRFPKSALRQNMLLGVAKTYEMMARFEDAAKTFEQFAHEYPTHTESKNALRVAALYYWGAGSQQKAQTVLGQFVSGYAKDRKTAENDLVDIYETSGNTDLLINYYARSRKEAMTSSDYVVFSAKLAETTQNQGYRNQVMTEGLRAFQRHPHDVLATKEGIEAASKLAFWATSARENSFNQIKLALPQRTLEANLKRKLELMKELDAEYTKIVSLGSPEWGLAAIYRTAAVYRRMAMEVREAPVPAELTAEQLEVYRGEIQKQLIKPFNEKALAMSTQCLDKSQEFNVLSNWTPRCYQLAAELNPTLFPSVRTFYLPPLQVAMLTPKETQMPVGNLPVFAYPFYSPGLFGGNDRAPAMVLHDANALYDTVRQSGNLDSGTLSPQMVTFTAINEERKDMLQKNLEKEKPHDRQLSFSYLNFVRLSAPNRAIPLILEALQREPENVALHNLLALSYLEDGKHAPAKVTWLALIARGIKNSTIYNNLGVTYLSEGKEKIALGYFHEASLMESPREALLNLGFLALKYRNGFEAKKEFEKAIELRKEDVTAQGGYGAALLQNREIDSSRDMLVNAVTGHHSDPYSRLSLAYYYIDVEKEPDRAKKLLSEYMEYQNVGEDKLFRQALQSATRLPSGESGDSVPSITP